MSRAQSPSRSSVGAGRAPTSTGPRQNDKIGARSLSVHVYPLAGNRLSLQVWVHRWGADRPTSLRNAWGPPVALSGTTFADCLREAAYELLRQADNLPD